MWIDVAVTGCNMAVHNVVHGFVHGPDVLRVGEASLSKASVERRGKERET